MISLYRNFERQDKDNIQLILDGKSGGTENYDETEDDDDDDDDVTVLPLPRSIETRFSNGASQTGVSPQGVRLTNGSNSNIHHYSDNMTGKTNKVASFCNRTN
jgi:hypothetical protein